MPWRSLGRDSRSVDRSKAWCSPSELSYGVQTLITRCWRTRQQDCLPGLERWETIGHRAFGRDISSQLGRMQAGA